MKNLCKCLLALVLLCVTACKDKQNPVTDQVPVFELTDYTPNRTPLVLVSDETCQLEYRAEHITHITANHVPEGWQVTVNQETSRIGITAPPASADTGQAFTLQLTAQGENGQTVSIGIDLYRATFDDPEGTFVLNEGNMTSENGSLLYLTPEGYIVNDAYKRVNGSELGNVPQDMCHYDGRTYIIAQNGNGNAIGAESENDGMLVIADTRTLKKVKSYPKETLNRLDWPTHIAVIDDEHIYIRDNAGVWRLNDNDASLTFIEGSEGAPKAPFAIAGGKVYTFYNQGTETGLLEIAPGNDRAATIRLSSSTLYGITSIASAPESHLWIMSTKHEEEASMNRYDPVTRTLEQNSISDVPANSSSGRAFATSGNTVYYAIGTSIYRLKFQADREPSDNEPQDEMLIDLASLDDNAQVTYNGLGVNPVNGYVYANTLKGVGPYYTTNQLWAFDFTQSTDTPLYKYENYTRFPAGFFFNNTSKELKQ